MMALSNGGAAGSRGGAMGNKVVVTFLDGEELSGTMSGTMTLNESTGWIKSGEITQQITGTTKGVPTKSEGKTTFQSERKRNTD